MKLKRYECKNCNGSGTIVRWEEGMHKCPTCGGFGYVPDFKIECGDIIENRETCPICDGSGKVRLYRTVKCGSCNGQGWYEWPD